MDPVSFFVEKFWITFPGTFEPVQNFFNGNFFFVLKNKLEPYPTARILDLGCGAGSLLTAFDPKLYVGVDINPSLIKLAQKTYAGRSRTAFVSADALKFTGKQRFDLVVMASFIHHLDDKRLAKLLTHLDKRINFKFLLAVDGKPLPTVIKPFLELLDLGADFREVKQLLPFFEKNFRVVEKGNLRVNKPWYHYPFVLVEKK